jgi:protein-S-isoprenylcysteine O-methyltransferase Ste14
MTENKIIKVSLISILSYLIFKKSYHILSQLLNLLSFKLQIENDSIWMFLNLTIGVLCLWLLSFLYNLFLNKEKFQLKEIYILLLVLLIIYSTAVGMNYAIGKYFSEMIFYPSRESYLTRFEWTQGIDNLISIIGLIIFLWKIRRNKNTVANNG